MKRLFTQMAEHKISSAACSDFLSTLPEVIRKHTDWEYTYQKSDSGCFLKPTFRNMPYRNSFVPELHIAVSNHEADTLLQITGQPVKLVRVFMAFWFGFLLLMEAFLLLLAIPSILDQVFPFFIPPAMCAFGYLLCKLGTKWTFNSVMRAIQREFS